MKSKKSRPYIDSYKRRKNIFNQLSNNRNNSSYLALILVMLAAIVVIAATVINNPNEVISPSATNTGNAYENVTATTLEQIPNNSQPASSAEGVSPETSKNDVSKSELTISIIENERLTLIVDADDKQINKIVKSFPCGLSDNIKIDENSADVNIKKLWFSSSDSESFYQFYSVIDGTEFHSAAYSEDGNKGSLINDSFKYIGNKNAYSEWNGVTLSVASARYIYENMALTVTVSRFDSLAKFNSFYNTDYSYSDLIKEEICEDIKLFSDGRIMDIPKVVSSDPTDNYSNTTWCPYEVGEITQTSKNNVYAFGTIATSILNRDINYILTLFNDIKAYSTDGTDITQYLIISTDKEYTPEELNSINSKGYLMPGEYKFIFTIIDKFGHFKSTEVSLIIN